jgi:formylmethanofuran dehydrogenase subunit E
MCGVDAIQYLTGCTYGKGNLIHRDYGKNAFSFFDRNKSRGIRLVLQPDARGADHDEMAELMSKNSSGELSGHEKQRLADLRTEMQKKLMGLPLQEMFDCQNLEMRPPRPARILESLVCEACHEQTMESRTRRFGGRVLCIPCYEKVEQKI